MLRKLIELLGVDYEQWRALTKIALKLDLRVAGMGVGQAGTQERSHGIRIWFANVLSVPRMYPFFHSPIHLTGNNNIV